MIKAAKHVTMFKPGQHAGRGQHRGRAQGTGQCRRKFLGMLIENLPKNTVQLGLAFHAMTWKLRTGLVWYH